MIQMQNIWEYLFVARASHTLICESPTDEQLKTEKNYYNQLMTFAAALAIKGEISKKSEEYFLDLGWIGKTKERFCREYEQAKVLEFKSIRELEDIFDVNMNGFSKAYKLLMEHFSERKKTISQI